MKTPKELAETLFGAVEWIDTERGYCSCPGRSLHTRPTKSVDCTVFVSGVPTVHCFHTSCRDQIESANRRFRSALASGTVCSATLHSRTARSGLETARQLERASFERLKKRAEDSQAQILAKYDTEPANLFEQSPLRLLSEPEGDWRLMLSLFRLEDIVWIGDVADSGPGHAHNFRLVTDWMKEKEAPGSFTCPSTFKPGAFSRSKDNVASRRFLVIESDYLSKPEICAVFGWVSQFLRLRAVVDTAGKSLHGWFEFPLSSAVEAELKIILPALGCDPAMFKPSQPCRLAGAKRGDKVQALVYLDLNGGAL
ncbi:MAG: hypothetical protein JWR69_4403 [Pedosphaera sp.]|nr:hypothetical protein [Pedosphaera sp.]